MMPQEEADVVVIGSGIGGLTAARMLAEFGGRRVLVLEQHYTLGGMMHEFTREGRYHFGTGVHYPTAGPGPVLHYLADGRAQFHRLPYDYDMLHFPGFDFAVPASETEFRARLKARFSEEAGSVDRFFDIARKASRGLSAPALHFPTRRDRRSSRPPTRRVCHSGSPAVKAYAGHAARACSPANSRRTARRCSSPRRRPLRAGFWPARRFQGPIWRSIGSRVDPTNPVDRLSLLIATSSSIRRLRAAHPSKGELP
jgi:phytoene dehydrogenase-like protein